MRKTPIIIFGLVITNAALRWGPVQADDQNERIRAVFHPRTSVDFSDA